MVRPLGSTGAQVFVESAGPGAAKLRAGVRVSLAVLEKLAPGLYRISGAGQVFAARSQADLSVGSLLRARVEHAPGGLVFRLETALSAPSSPGDALLRYDSILRREGFVPDQLGRLAAAALLAEGLKPEAEALLRLRKAAASSQGPDTLEKRLRLGARLEAKGLGATAGAIDALVDAMDGPAGRGGQGPSQGNADGQGQGGKGRSQSRELPGGAAPEESAGADGLPPILGRLIKEACFGGRTEGNGPAKDGDDSLSMAAILRLFNHARAAEGANNWIIVPFSFALDSVAFTGSFRILLPCMPGGPGRIEASFRAGPGIDGDAGSPAEARDWDFALFFGAGKPRLVIGAEGRRKELERFLPHLRATLAGSGCAVEMGFPQSRGLDGSVVIDA